MNIFRSILLFKEKKLMPNSLLLIYINIAPSIISCWDFIGKLKKKTKQRPHGWTVYTWRWLLMWAILSPFTRICCKIRFGVASAKPFCCIFICSSQFSDLQKVPSHLNLIFDVSGAHTLTREREERHDTRSKHIYVVFCTQKFWYGLWDKSYCKHKLIFLFSDIFSRCEVME